MPTAGLLRAVLQSVMIERGYGVFVGPVTCDAWSLLHDSALKQNKAALLLFSFTGPMLSHSRIELWFMFIKQANNV